MKRLQLNLIYKDCLNSHGKEKLCINLSIDIIISTNAVVCNDV